MAWVDDGQETSPKIKAWFDRNVCPRGLVRPPAFVRVGHLPRLRPVRAAVADMVGPARFLRLGRQVQRPHGTPNTALNVIGYSS